MQLSCLNNVCIYVGQSMRAKSAQGSSVVDAHPARVDDRRECERIQADFDLLISEPNYCLQNPVGLSFLPSFLHVFLSQHPHLSSSFFVTLCIHLRPRKSSRKSSKDFSSVSKHPDESCRNHTHPHPSSFPTGHGPTTTRRGRPLELSTTLRDPARPGG